jgi:hypothetical protein
MNKDTIIAEYDFDADIKDTVNRYRLEKMLKEIKTAMNKHGKIKVVIEKSS